MHAALYKGLASGETTYFKRVGHGSGNTVDMAPRRQTRVWSCCQSTGCIAFETAFLGARMDSKDGRMQGGRRYSIKVWSFVPDQDSFQQASNHSTIATSNAHRLQSRPLQFASSRQNAIFQHPHQPFGARCHPAGQRPRLRPDCSSRRADLQCRRRPGSWQSFPVRRAHVNSNRAGSTSRATSHSAPVGSP